MAGLESPLRHGITRGIVKITARKGVIEELSKGSVDDQTGRLNEMVGEGALSSGKLKNTLMTKAPKEMDKAIKKYRKQGKDITVDSLCAEIKSEKGFLNMCEKVGLNLEWFEKLAQERMEANGVV